MKLKILLLLPFLLICRPLFAQDTLQEFYTYSWKKTDKNSAYYYRFAVKENGRWHARDYYMSTKALQMDGYFSDDSLAVRDGYYTYYQVNGDKEDEGLYHNNKKQGLWRGYDTKGVVNDTCHYIEGMPTGISSQWYDGHVTYLGNFDNDGKGTGTVTTYHENGQVESSGHMGEGCNKDGTWVYTDPKGIVSLKEHYANGTLTKRECFNEKGQPEQKDNCTDFEAAQPDFDYNAYLAKNMKHPYPNSRMAAVTVVTRFYIDENGRVKDVQTNGEAPAAFEEEVIRVLKAMPKWKPGYRYNRKVKMYMRLPVSFKIPD